MIKVTVGNNVKREAVIIDENTTLRSCLEANGVDYTRGVMHLDGSSLNPGDFMGRLFSWGIGGIGRHNRFKFCWRMPYRFKSDIPHQDKNELRCFCVQDKHYIDTVYVRGG